MGFIVGLIIGRWKFCLLRERMLTFEWVGPPDKANCKHLSDTINTASDIEIWMVSP